MTMQRFVQLVIYAVVAVTVMLVLQTIVSCVTVHLPIKINQVKELQSENK